MVTALYRRYRPETFAELIGQSHVTDPLRAALRSDRVNHAYLFSGPRGCGKTTSARILARCLNCAEGPTDTPCGVCPSCVELSREGGGSLDVVEIDAASHGGVDDARDLRERAIFAPARDRYKIFIIDEAHMVTSGGFNALLKIVEEPPEHVKFIFATTEPEKVIGTIRSRTHHYPFRLVPPAQLLQYVHELADSEGVQIAQGVLPLVVRAGGGSVRDSLSLLDQLIAGSDADTVTYERAVALLGYTHAALLDDVVDAIAAADPAAAFGAIDRVVQTGQDPRRFVDDLLERLRDLIVVQATGAQAASVLRGVPDDDLARMRDQSSRFAPADLSTAADVVNRALTEMTGATSPRLHLELMMARVLVTAAPGVAAARPAGAATARSAAPGGSAPSSASPASGGPPSDPPPSASTDAPATAESAVDVAPPAAEAQAVPSGPLTLESLRAHWPEVLERIQSVKMSAWTVMYLAQPAALDDGDVLTIAFTSAGDANRFKERTNPTESVSEQVRNAIQHVLGHRVKFKVRVDEGQPAAAPSASIDEAPPADPDPAPEPEPEPVAATPAQPAPAPVERTPRPRNPAPVPQSSAPVTGWDVVAIPGSAAAASADPRPLDAEDLPPLDDADAPDDESAPATEDGSAPPEPVIERRVPSAPVAIHPADAAGRQRYGEAVVREVLGARFLAEEAVESAVSLTSEPPRDE
ncbi:DNA polymerase III subunit gamma and tau [Microcella flavibacter]|uniref:DNA polymerase III subunit gamma and tau n=1 Tax=Microcella flavibacter TaxID=1804990 RepID=UPI0014565055|nr:DNA polymerase III subunit gamma and tau [Microcella flavibacter]